MNGSSDGRPLTPLVTAQLIPTDFQLLAMFRSLYYFTSSMVEHLFCVERFKN